MKNREKNTEVKDIKVNTQECPDDFGRIAPSAPGRPVSFIEVEEDTVLVNPDFDSMESRG